MEEPNSRERGLFTSAMSEKDVYIHLSEINQARIAHMKVISDVRTEEGG